MRYLLSQLNKIKVAHLLGLFILILPFSHVFWRDMAIWYAQSRFFYLGILIIFGYSLFMPSTKALHERVTRNLPLTLLFIWLTFITSQWWYAVMATNKQYPILTLFPYLSFIIGIILYKLIIDYLNANHISKILNLFSLAIGIMGIYTILQYLNLDQFYKHFNTLGISDATVGILGNPSHFGIYLATLLPILYYTRTKLSTISIPITWLAIILTGSASGLVIAILITIIYTLYYQIRFKHERLIAEGIAILFLLIIYIRKLDLINFFTDSHRLAFWDNLMLTFKQFPITGAGLGRLQGMLPSRIGTQFMGWGHAHNEYLQIMVEGGLIALALVIACISHYFITFKYTRRTELSVCLMTIFIGFLLSSLVSYPVHLAVPVTMGIFSYSGIYVIKGEII